jgi:Ala-tRNA(Pro) deacylase
MNLQNFLDEHGVNYRLSHHDPTYTSQDLAASEHIPGRKVIKPVVIRADGHWIMCALPASYRVDLRELREQLRADEVTLADEATLERLFPGCELGAAPPIGKLFGMQTLMDESLTADDTVTFQTGTHTDAVTMPLLDYRRIADAEIAHFGRHA